MLTVTRHRRVTLRCHDGQLAALVAVLVAMFVAVHASISCIGEHLTLLSSTVLRSAMNCRPLQRTPGSRQLVCGGRPGKASCATERGVLLTTWPRRTT